MKRFASVVAIALLALATLAIPAFANEKEDIVYEAVDEMLTNLPKDDWRQIKNEILNQKMDLGEDMLIVDVRWPEEYEAGHIPGAINIPVTDLAQQIYKLPAEKDFPIYVCCRSGVRSFWATAALRMLGYENAYNIVGGFLAWESAGFDIEK